MPLQVYKVVKPLGELGNEGDLVHLDAEEATPLVEAGVLEEAQSEDMADDGDGDEAQEPETAAMVQRAMKKLKADVQENVADKVADKIASRFTTKTHKHTGFTSAPATVKESVFKSMAQMLQAQVKANKGDRRAQGMLYAYDQELKVKSPLGSGESSSSIGGYFVKPQWADEIFDKVRDYPNLLGMTSTVNIDSNTYNIPELNETSLADGSRHGGVLGFWLNAEGATITSSYPSAAQTQLVINPLAILVYVTNQLLADSNIENFQKFLEEKVGLEVRWQENDAILNGSGSAMPLGVVNERSVITVTHSANDTNAMFSFTDLRKMFTALYPPSRPRSVWIMNSEAYGILLSQSFATVSDTATTYPALGLSYNFMDQSFPMRIFGRPVIECMNNPQLGLPGDIVLADLSQTVTAQKPGLEVAQSSDIQFPTYQTAFRFIRRWDSRSPWVASLTSKDGHYSYAPYVILSSRGT